MQKRRMHHLVFPVAALISLTACNDLGIGSDETMSISFSVPRVASSVGRSAALVPITDGTSTIDLQSVDVTLSDVRIERVRGVPGNDSSRHKNSSHDDSDRRDGHKLRAGAITVSLPLEGGVITPISGPLPDGSYDEIRFDVAFVRARGTFDGESFDLTVQVKARIDVDLDPVFVVDSDDDRLNVTITIDLAKWFVGADNKLVDPGLAQTNQALLRTITNSIRASFRAFEDSDRDADDGDTDTDTDRRHRG